MCNLKEIQTEDGVVLCQADAYGHPAAGLVCPMPGRVEAAAPGHVGARPAGWGQSVGGPAVVRPGHTQVARAGQVRPQGGL